MTANQESSFTFGLVGSKLVWLSLDEKKIQHVDFDELLQATESQEDGAVRWASIKSPAFSILQFLNNVSKEELVRQGITIDEIPSGSLLHLKKDRQQNHSDKSNYLQLTIGMKLMVYDLGPAELSEVSMI